MNGFGTEQTTNSTFFFPLYRLRALRKGHRRHQLQLLGDQTDTYRRLTGLVNHNTLQHVQDDDDGDGDGNCPSIPDISNQQFSSSSQL